MLLAAVFTLSCRSARIDLSILRVSAERGAIEEWLPYPYCYADDPLRLEQRILLSAAGTEMDMRGYLVVGAEGDWLALALGGMGVEHFRFQKSAEEMEVQGAPPGFPPKPLRNGVAEDIDFLFGRLRPLRIWSSPAGAENELRVLKLGEGEYAEFRFDDESGRPSAARHLCDGSLVRTVRYADYRLDSSGHAVVPHRVLIVNHRWHYEIEIVLYRLKDLSR